MEKKDKFEKRKKMHWQSYETKKDNQLLDNLRSKEFITPPQLNVDDEKKYELNRKTFLKLMGASTLMTTISCVRRPVEKIIPYVDLNGKKTDGEQFDFARTGQHYHYASVAGCDDHCGVLIKCQEGRPIKINGNPNHPLSKGGTCASAQASIFDLYDPDRTKNPKKVKGNKNISWSDLDKNIQDELKIANGKTIILTKPLQSPSSKVLIDRFIEQVGGKHLEYSLTSPHSSIAEGQKLSYGQSIIPDYDFSKAKVIVSIDCDFLGTWLSSTQYKSQFAQMRELKKRNPKFNQYIAVESIPTLTGTNADQRIAIQPNDQRKFVIALAKAISDNLGDNDYKKLLSQYSVENLCNEIQISSKIVQKLASILQKHKRQSLIVAGGVSSQNNESVDLQIAVNLINSILENDGKTVLHSKPIKSNFISYESNLEVLKNSLDKNEVDVLLIYDVNLLYQLPDSDAWKKRLRKAKLLVSMIEKADETSLIADYIAPTTHYLESWDDIEFVQGIYSIQQPAIRPLFDNRSFQDSLIAWSGGKIDNFGSYYEYLKNRWVNRLGSNYNWEEFLRKGCNVDKINSVLSESRSFLLSNLKPLTKTKNELKLSLFENTAIKDGRQSNNSLLQELPDPVSKVTWDNYLALSPQLAQEKNIKQNDVIKIQVHGKEISLPAYVQPGMHKNTLGVAIGYGRTVCGSVGNGVGKNTYRFGKYENKRYILSGFSCKIEKTDKKYKLASTQHHHMMSPGKGWKDRPLIMSTTFENYLKDPASGIIEPEIPKIMINGKKQLSKGANPSFPYDGYKWEMVVDLTKCTGCSACIISCQVENNIPVVGRDEVRLGREMHWLRIDRYYIGDPDKPETLEFAHQPVMCQHCDDAPCETVCPVLATVHSSEGTNDMVYNRCVGTRYCANNCPYKVRRFNWLEHWYGKEQSRPPRNLGLNPDITVRSRGVMEKCNFCASEIANKKITAKNEGRTVKDGDIKTACQSACASDAISFGNINDPKSKVSKDKKDERAFKLLEYLNVKPAVTYLSRVKNPI